MADTSAQASPYFRRPLYIYDLPPELLETLTLQTEGNLVPELKPDAQIQAPPNELAHSASSESGISVSTTCTLCHAAFNSVTAQREHVRSDFHRYNLKLSLRGAPPLDEQTFIKQIGDLDESISGSDSDDSELEQADGEHKHHNDSTLATLLRRQAKMSDHAADNNDDDNDPTSKRKTRSGGAPILWLSSPKAGNDVGLGIYKAILSNTEQESIPSQLVEILKAKQIAPIPLKRKDKTTEAAGVIDNTGPHFFLCMIGGGHFAAAVIRLAPELRKGPGGVDERHAIVVAHKTFHRYTTRRKQGGSQSANDNAKGNAHSAGSSIRRYNEIALEADVRGILLEWRSLIASAELLFVRASGTTSRRTLFGPYEDQILYKNDVRLRGFPFSTRRATQAELLRAFQELTRVKLSTFTHVTEEQPMKAKVTPLKPKQILSERSEEEEAAILHTTQLYNLIRRTKAPAVLLYLTKNELDPNFEFFPPNEHHHAPRPLHLSSSINSAALITALLTKAKADPTIVNADGKTAYDLAGEVKTRDAFRVARHQLGENSWNWSDAHVPSSLSPEEADSKAKREQDSAAAAEGERRRAELESLRLQEEQRQLSRMERKVGPGKALGGSVEKTGSEKREEEMRGLTPEMRQRLERERRARAAEARIKASSGKS